MKYILAFLFFYTLGTQAHNFCLIQNDSTNFVNKATEGIPKLLYAFMEDYKATFENYGEGEIDVNEKDGMELFNAKFIDGYENFDNPAESGQRQLTKALARVSRALLCRSPLVFRTQTLLSLQRAPVDKSKRCD